MRGRERGHRTSEPSSENPRESLLESCSAERKRAPEDNSWRGRFIKKKMGLGILFRGTFVSRRFSFFLREDGWDGLEGEGGGLLAELLLAFE